MFYSANSEKCECYNGYTLDKNGKCIADKVSNGATNALVASKEELVNSDPTPKTNSFSEV
jgi:hypothetical protein